MPLIQPRRHFRCALAEELAIPGSGEAEPVSQVPADAFNRQQNWLRAGALENIATKEFRHG